MAQAAEPTAIVVRGAVKLCFTVVGQTQVVVVVVVYVPATSKVTEGQVLIYDSTHSWRLYSAASLGNQAASIITYYPTQSHYPDTDPSLPYPNNAERLVRKQQVSI